MQRLAALVAGMRAPRRLSIDSNDIGGDNIGFARAQSLHPGRKAVLEQVGIDRPDYLAQRIVARDTVRIRPQAAQKRQVACTPQRHLDKIIGPGQRRAQQQQNDLRQRIENLCRLPRVVQRRKPIEQTDSDRLIHPAASPVAAPDESQNHSARNPRPIHPIALGFWRGGLTVGEGGPYKRPPALAGLLGE